MTEVFIRKYWDEDDIIFYLHFQDEEAVRQIEIGPQGDRYLTIDSPFQGEAMLYDQNLDELDLDKDDFITRETFEAAWQKKK